MLLCGQAYHEGDDYESEEDEPQEVATMMACLEVACDDGMAGGGMLFSRRWLRKPRLSTC